MSRSRSPILPRHVHRGLWLAFVPLVAALVFLVLRSLFPATPTLAYRLQQQTISNAQHVGQLKANGIKPAGPDPAQISKGKATAIPPAVSPTSPAPVYKTGPQGPQGPGPTNTQVLTAVGKYFAAHPVKPPVSAAQITAQAASFVARYLRAHPAPKGDTGPSGSPGVAGVPGPGPSDQQIATAVQDYLPAAVAVYLAANPPASGAPGSPGVAGSPGAACDPDVNPKCIGPSGATGENGAPPASWTWTDPTGVKHTCTRDPGSPDDAPTYTCDSVPTPTTSPS